MTRRRAFTLGAAGALTLSLLAAPHPVAAVDDVDTQALRDQVSAGGILEHERAFQRIANRHDGTRASGTPGYDASVRYVARTLRNAGLRVRVQDFTFPFWQELAEPLLGQVAPDAQSYETMTLEYSGSGDVTGALVPADDIQIPPPDQPGTAPGGCEASAFDPAPSGQAVALVQRGTCTFHQKAVNAQNAGYDALVVFNEGQPGRQELPTGATLGEPVDIPVVFASYDDGAALYEQVQQGDDVVVRVVTDTTFDPDARTANVLATYPGGDRERTIVAGAHLDSVIDGAGINDNGSGSAALLDIAESMAEIDVRPRQRVVFAFWGAEESGLLGSEHYVATLRDRRLREIKANLNFDMIGSPNYVRFVYDGDGSDIAPAGPPGSAQIEQVFTDYFENQGLESRPTQFSGRSDYGPFIEVGIPAGGLFTGAEGVKTAEEAAVFGGQEGEAYDPCYHAACDDMSNLSTQALAEMGDAAAHAVATLALSRTGFFEDGSFRVRDGRAAERLRQRDQESSGRTAARHWEWRGSHLVR